MLTRLVYTLILLSAPAGAKTKISDETMELKLKGFNQMREALAGTLIGVDRAAINEETFKRVCMPVGLEFKTWGKANEFTVKQVSEKNRNSAAAPTPIEAKVLEKFKLDKNLNFEKAVNTVGSVTATTYYYRIPVAKACLACHGSKRSLPDFITKKYPHDKAFGFKEGDLRGLYSVTVPHEP